MVIRDLSTSVTLPGLCHPRVRLMNRDHCLARRAVGAGAPSWPRPFQLWGVWVRFFCCSGARSPFWGSRPALHRARGTHPDLASPSLPAASLEAFIASFAFLSKSDHFSCVQIRVYNHKQDDILIIIHFTKRFTIVHF